MRHEPLTVVSTWLAPLGWSAAAVLTSALLGLLVVKTIGRRLSAWAARTAWKWDDLLIDALRRGIPFWSLLIGVYVAVGFWPLSAHAATVLSQTVYVLIWLSITVVCAGLAGKIVVLYGTQLQHAVPVTSLTEHIVKILIVILGLLMILNGLGIPITPLLTALGVSGLAVALALQDTLANLFAGLYLAMARQVRVGDYVKLESGQEGYVEDIGWRATMIRMLPNNMVLVPNTKLSGAIIINYHLPTRELAVLVDVGVSYGSDLGHVERVTCDVAKEVMQTVPGGVPGFEPFIRYHTFGEYSVNFTVILRGKEFVDQYLIKHEFIKRLHVRYEQAGIVIPFPIRTMLTKEAE